MVATVHAFFWNFFCWYNIRVQLINFKMVNDDRKLERRVWLVLLDVIRKSPTPSENRLAAILN